MHFARYTIHLLLQLRLCKILKVLPFEMLLVFCIDRHHEHLPHGRDPNVTSCPFSMESDVGQYSFSCLRVGFMSSCRVDHVFVSA